MLKALCAVFVLAVLAIGGSGTAQAREQVTIYAGLYTCYASYAAGGTFSGGVALYTNNRYAYSYDVAGNPPRSLRRPGWGRIRITGTRIAFIGGPWRSHYAVIKAPKKMTIYLKGERYPYTFCNLRRGF